jgi:hypothetical protein
LALRPNSRLDVMVNNAIAIANIEKTTLMIGGATVNADGVFLGCMPSLM